MTAQRRDPRFRIKKSTLPYAGNGLFANKPIAKGAKLQIVGVFIERGSVADECTRYADKHKFRVGSRLLIPMGYAGLVNHSLSPNLEKIVKGKKAYFQALRPIQPGEELFFCYHPYAQKRFHLNKAGKRSKAK